MDGSVSKNANRNFYIHYRLKVEKFREGPKEESNGKLPCSYFSSGVAATLLGPQSSPRRRFRPNEETYGDNSAAVVVKCRVRFEHNALDGSRLGQRGAKRCLFAARLRRSVTHFFPPPS